MDSLIEDGARIAAGTLSFSDGLADLAHLTVDDDFGRRISHGSVFSPEELPIQGPTAVVDGGGRLLAVYVRQGAAVKAEVVVA
jgi:hypothetical protein